MPLIKGCTTRATASAPKWPRAKSATLASSALSRGFWVASPTTRSLVRSERRELAMNSAGDAGEGSATSFPLAAT